MLEVVLKPGRDRSVRRRHPWVLSGSVARVEGEETPGALARVLSAEGEVLGHGHFSPHSSLRVRLLTFGKDAPGDALLSERIALAVERRASDPLCADTDSVRLVNSEGDGLPGLIVDRYADVVVAKLATAGMAARREEVGEALRKASGAASGFERSDSTAARREGIPARDGALWGEVPEGPVTIREGGRRYEVDFAHGQKTGFYLDQRDSRALVEQLAGGRRVLDLFSYTGGFAVAAAAGGAAEVTLVESSAAALGVARRNLEANAPDVPSRFEETDAFRYVRRPGPDFDLIVIDPPPLARHKGDVMRASRAYKDVMLFALRRAAEGALVLTFACSHQIGPDLFRKITFGASVDADRPVQVLRTLGAPSDHPVALDHPEGVYLSGLLLRA